MNVKNKESKKKMNDTLNQVLEFLKISEDSIYTNVTTCEMVKTVSKNIICLEDTGFLHEPATLCALFAPTGALQETSIDNGWGEEYIKLAEQFDEISEIYPWDKL